MSFGPYKLDIEYYPGSEISRKGFWTVTDQDDNPVNLTGVELEMQVKFSPKDHLSRAFIVFKTTDGTITVGGDDGNEITLNGVYQIEERHYYHDLLRKDVNDYVWYGKFIVTTNVTRI